MLTRTPKPQRKATNLSIDQNLVAEAKALDLNVSQLAEAGIAAAVRDRKAQLWLEENREAIEENNRYFQEHGLPFAEYRGF